MNQSFVWLGLEERADISVGPNNPERYVRAQSMERNSFTAEPSFGENPWDSGQPDGSLLSDTCVGLSISTELLSDALCGTTGLYLCERSCSGECEDGLEYSVSANQGFTFDDAQAFCEENGSRLAVPTSKERMDRIRDFADGFSAISAHVGLSDPNPIPNALNDGNTKRFVDVNGGANGFTSREDRVFPWNGGDPNGLSEEDCVQLSVSGNVLRDEPCDRVITTVCEKKL